MSDYLSLGQQLQSLLQTFEEVAPILNENTRRANNYNGDCQRFVKLLQSQENSRPIMCGKMEDFRLVKKFTKVYDGGPNSFKGCDIHIYYRIKEILGWHLKYCETLRVEQIEVDNTNLILQVTPVPGRELPANCKFYCLHVVDLSITCSAITALQAIARAVNTRRKLRNMAKFQALVRGHQQRWKCPCFTWEY
jgi:hypothetical protein